jgi:phage terminase large subunit
MFQTAPLYERIINSPADIIVLQGGTSSGKTYAAMQAFNTWAHENNDAIMTVVGQDIPNLKRGALRDQQQIVQSSPALQSIITDYNKSQRLYTFATGTRMDSPQNPVRGNSYLQTR